MAGQDGTVLDLLARNRRNRAAAGRFFRRLLKEIGAVPRVIATGTLRSCGAARREVMPPAGRRSHQGLNRRAENSYRPTRQRERARKGFCGVG